MIPKLPYYARRSGGGRQGLIIEETTGRTVALAYELEETPVLAAAPALASLVRDWEAAEHEGAEYYATAKPGLLRRAREVLSNIKEPM